MSFTVPCLKKHHEESLIHLSSDKLRRVVSAFESICGELFYKIQSPGPHPDLQNEKLGDSETCSSLATPGLIADPLGLVSCSLTVLAPSASAGPMCGHAAVTTPQTYEAPGSGCEALFPGP